jgi:hypothetical protein
MAGPSTIGSISVVQHPQILIIIFPGVATLDALEFLIA